MTNKKAQSWRDAIPKRLTELRRRVEKRAQKRLDEVTDMLPMAPRKALKRLSANAERAQKDFRKGAEKAITQARKRAEEITGKVQERIEDAVTPLVKRLDVASRAEVNALNKRVRELERRLHRQSHAA